MNSVTEQNGPILAFGAHPDDIEFGCGAIIYAETRRGRHAHFVVTSAGDAATNGTPEEREEESKKAASILGAQIVFMHLDADAHLEIKSQHILALARMIRRTKPSVVLAPTVAENQHPDHFRLGSMVRDAARLARYGGVKELRGIEPWAVGQLLFFAVTPNAVLTDVTPILIDVSDEEVIAKWTDAMNAHGSQASTRNYLELQLTRAKLLGAQAGVSHAIALYPNDPILFNSLSSIGMGARRF